MIARAVAREERTRRRWARSGFVNFLRIAHVLFSSYIGDEENTFYVVIFCTHVEIATPPRILMQRIFSVLSSSCPAHLIHFYFCQQLCQQPPVSTTISWVLAQLFIISRSCFGIGSHMSKSFKTLAPWMIIQILYWIIFSMINDYLCWNK